MVSYRSRADLDHLSQALQALEARYPGTQAWDDSPHKWVLSLASASKGSVGRQLAMDWGRSLGITLKQVSIDKQIYLELDDVRIQVKFSTLWDSGYYRFQQIRDKDYDFCLCLGVAPFDMNSWLIPKAALDIYVIGSKGQHTGAGSGETWWLEASPTGQEQWLEDFGGQLADVGMELQRLASGTY